MVVRRKKRSYSRKKRINVPLVSTAAGLAIFTALNGSTAVNDALKGNIGTALNTVATAMTALGSLYGQSTTASIQVPSQASSIVGVIATIATDSATNGAATFAMQLSGDGLSNGQETITIGSQGVDGTTASNGMTNSPLTLDVAIPVVGSNQVSVAVAMDVDVGSAQASITLVFQ
jgi:hypothetical protein